MVEDIAVGTAVIGEQVGAILTQSHAVTVSDGRESKVTVHELDCEISATERE